MLSFRQAAGLALAILVLSVSGCSNGPPLQPWHTEALTEEFRVGDRVKSLDDYLRLEDRLFQQLDAEVYAKTPTGPRHALQRYGRGSAADPTRRQPNWNRTSELSAAEPVGGVLLLHGMSDSPYSLHALGESINRAGYHVVGLRLPGHGTAPSGLRHVTWQDMAAAVRLGSLAYLSILDEFDPYKYNSFATNAGAQVHGITRNVDQRIQALARDSAAADKLPPILVLKSTVDATVTTEAVVDNLLMRLVKKSQTRPRAVY